MKEFYTSKQENLAALQEGGSLVIDGGQLLHQGQFISGESFGDIVLRYVLIVQKVAAGRRCTVVFDNYTRKSPKDHEH